jgi:hypothetical protein
MCVFVHSRDKFNAWFAFSLLVTTLVGVANHLGRLRLRREIQRREDLKEKQHEKIDAALKYQVAFIREFNERDRKAAARASGPLESLSCRFWDWATSAYALSSADTAAPTTQSATRTRQSSMGCPTSGVAQRAMREAVPHTRCVSKARHL